MYTHIINIISLIILIYWIYINYFYVLEYFLNTYFYYSNIKLDKSNHNNLLLLSNSTMKLFGKGNHLEYAYPLVKTFLDQNNVKDILFITYAYPNVRDNKNTYYADNFFNQNVRLFFNKLNINVTNLNTNSSPSEQQEKIKNASAIYMSGGNTFVLTNHLHKNGIMSILREKIKRGMPYIGVSAGTNIVSPTMQTTNDMPVVCPLSCETLNIIPFQLNVHYNDFIEGKGFSGESRIQRLTEYLQYNRDLSINKTDYKISNVVSHIEAFNNIESKVSERNNNDRHKNDQNYILGLREGTAIHISGDKAELVGFKTRPASLLKLGGLDEDGKENIIENKINIGNRIDYLL